MVSTAIYARIDPGTPAIFSPTIVTGMLRGDLGFRGVIVTDDIGGAAQVAQRAGRTARGASSSRPAATMVLTVVAEHRRRRWPPRCSPGRSATPRSGDMVERRRAARAAGQAAAGLL